MAANMSSFVWLLAAVCMTLNQEYCFANDLKTFLDDDVHYYETLNYDPQSTFEQQTRRQKRSSLEENPAERKISFSALNREFRLHLKPDYSIFHNDIQIRHGNGQPLELNHETLNFYDGIVASSASFSKGYCFGSIREGIFDGQILTEEGTYFVTKIPKRFSNALNETAHSVIYHEIHVKQSNASHMHGCGLTDSMQKWMDEVTRPLNGPKDNETNTPSPNTKEASLNDNKSNDLTNDQIGLKKSSQQPTHNAKETHYEGRRYKRQAGAKKVCSMYIRTDGMLYEAIGKEEYGQNSVKDNWDDDVIKDKIKGIIHIHVKKLNTIFQNHEFTSEIKTIQFLLLNLKIGDETREGCKPFCNRNLDSSPFLEIQSTEDHSKYCLAYAFTHRDWNSGVLGVAWVAGKGKAGGICENHKRTQKGLQSLNTGVVTLMNSGTRVPILKSELTFAHEVGHNLGSPHDNSPDCVPSGAKNYLMYAYSNSGNHPNNAKFSSCSHRNISKVLNEVVPDKNIQGGTTCLENFDGSFCGDGILDASKFISRTNS